MLKLTPINFEKKLISLRNMSSGFGSSFSRVGAGGSYSVSSSSSAGGVSQSMSSTTGGGVSMTQNSIGGNNVVTTREDGETVQIVLQGPGIIAEDTDVNIQGRRVRIQGLRENNFSHETQLSPSTIMETAQIDKTDGLVNITFQKQQN
eukprot:TRINITY_DN677_c0_g1_i6.p2 TRINITY_DN677_c0_g1~~TRINITY_DN677_c0_g1_i6.p2  ORF type:complete len:148 (-),score=18.62 TRINITY_DN677_c0_g1_i6:147-590(-)